MGRYDEGPYSSDDMFPPDFDQQVETRIAAAHQTRVRVVERPVPIFIVECSKGCPLNTRFYLLCEAQEFAKTWHCATRRNAIENGSLQPIDPIPVVR